MLWHRGSGAADIVAEFSEDPGGEDRAEAGLAGVDLSVRVLAKMGAHHRTQLVDLGAQGLDDGDLAGHDGGIGRLDHRWLPQLLGTQNRLQLCGLGVDVATAGSSQRGADPRLGEPGGLVGGGSAAEQLECVGGVEVGEGGERGGEEVPQRRPQPQHVSGAIPDQALVGAGG